VTKGDGVSLSVLTPTFRSGSFLPNNLASVSGSGAQHVVMDGGSDDGSVELLQVAQDVVWRSEPDRGQSDALNKALALATGEWIGWLNADEFYLPGVLPWIRRRLAQGDVDVLYGDFAEVDVDGRLLRLVTNHAYSGDILRRIHSYVPSCAVFMRRELVEQVGGWREDRRATMDYDLFLRLDAAGARFGWEPVVVSGFSRHDGQVTARQAAVAVAEMETARAELGVRNPPWRHYAARARRIVRKTVNGSYLRELRARPLKGTPLAAPAGDAGVAAAVARLNPQIAQPTEAAG
jgi:glycosyltransferase involved in cell wall biosynthesis